MAKEKEFKPSVSAESAFARALRKIARFSGHIVEAHVDGHEIKQVQEMDRALTAYSKLITPWAKRQSQKMMEQVSKKNKKAYHAKAQTISERLKVNVAENEVGRRAAQMMTEQVDLIQSIPLRAGQRAQKLALEAVYNGTRADEIAEALKRSTKVSESDAMRIARTEVARANASITQARAESVGAQAYVWETTMDGAERPSHREMNGKVILYSEPPTLSDGTVGHAGAHINCRCWQNPILQKE